MFSFSRASSMKMSPLKTAIIAAQASLFFAASAFADAAAPAAGARQPSTLETFMPIVFIFGVMYLLVIRPQVKRTKTHQKFVAELKKGDEVVTASGILGTIEGLTEKFITLEVAEGTRIRILRSQIGGLANTPTTK